MSALKIDITAIGGSTGTYDKASGPGQVASKCEIDLLGAANAAGGGRA